MRQFDPSSVPPAGGGSPPDDFPLFKRSDGRWAKKVRGKMCYFGRGTWQQALTLWLDQKDFLLAGRKPRESKPDGTTVKELCNSFMNSKQAALDGKTIKPRTLRDYLRVCELILKSFGGNRRADDVGREDFSALRAVLNQSYGIYRQKNLISFVKGVFYYGMEAELIGKVPNFGPDFSPPTKSSERKLRAVSKQRKFTPDEILRLLAVCNAPWRARVLLGINCGLGPFDLCELREGHLDLDAGVLDFPRPKTGIARRSVLWPETVRAVRDALRARPSPADPALADLVFLTARGRSWAKQGAGDMVSKMFRNVLKRAKLSGERNTTFYSLRHTFKSAGGRARDPEAVRLAMGHGQKGMGETYEEWFDDYRLKAVAVAVRTWLLGLRPWGTSLSGVAFPADVVAEVRADCCEFLQTVAVLPL